jgi:antitoxin HicB
VTNYFNGEIMPLLYKTLLLLEPQKEGGWTVTSPVLPELITEIDDLKKLQSVVSDAIIAVKELYEDIGKQFPAEILEESNAPVWFESLVSTEA